MSNWDEMQVKAKVLIEEALKVLKAGAKDAELIAGKTASSAKLHVAIKKNQVSKLKLLHELGEGVYKAAQQGEAHLTLSPKMKELVLKLRTIEKDIKRDNAKLEKFTVVKKKAKDDSDIQD